MNYANTLQAIDTLKALTFLELTPIQNGAYVRFACPACQKQAVIKAFGDKKNLWYCPACKEAGHIISLTMKLKGIEYEEAKDLLTEKSLSFPASKIKEELNLNYDLQYNAFLKEKGFTEEFCKEMGVGQPKGKTMLAGCTAFTIHNEEGLRIAYYGIKIKDGVPVFHKSFNPELYLFGYHRVDPTKETYFTSSMFDCLTIIQAGKQAVCNFGLPYVSSTQFSLIQNLDEISLFLEIDYIREIAHQFATNSVNFHRFVKKI